MSASKFYVLMGTPVVAFKLLPDNSRELYLYRLSLILASGLALLPRCAYLRVLSLQLDVRERSRPLFASMASLFSDQILFVRVSCMLSPILCSPLSLIASGSRARSR